MEGNGQKDQSKMDGQSNQINNNLPTRKPKLPPVLTPENIEKAYNRVKITGQLKACESVFNTGSPTILKWRKKFPHFRQRMLDALKDHAEMMKATHSEFFVQAMFGIKNMLEERIIESVTITEETEFDVTTNEPKSRKERKITKRNVREPSWQAIQKVLGKADLKEVIRKSIEGSSFDEKTNIIEKLFGDWVNDDDLGEDWNGDIYSELLDLSMIRILQARTRMAFDNGEIDIAKYNDMAIKQSKLFNQLMAERQKRIEKVIHGDSLEQIIRWLEVYEQNTVDIIADICYNTDLKKKEIPMEFYTRLIANENMKKYSRWAREDL